jgi:purine-binding chemotaxis protein CheW
MYLKDATHLADATHLKDSPAAAASGGGYRSHLDWIGLHRRLDLSQAAMERKLSPGPKEKQEILRARARSLALAPAPATWGKIEATSSGLRLDVVEFVLGPEHYGIELSHIREIHALSEFTPLPSTPAFVLGLVNVRGQILSIINIKKLFDLPEKGLTDLNKVIIVHAHHDSYHPSYQMELGILADAILGVRSIAREELHPALPTLTGIRAEYLKGITKDPLVVLDVEKILGDESILVNEAVNTAT